MDPLSGVASVIAVIQLTAAIVKICGRYTSKVKDAKQDIYDLQQEIKGLIGVLESLDELLQGSNGAKLIASQNLSENLRKCSSILISLKNRIDPEKTQKPMRRWGIRALKWPLKRTDVDSIIREIERYKVSLSLALQIDQARNTDTIDQKISLQGLKTAKGAAFDSYENQHDDCLQGTREDILCQIEKWVTSPDEKCIFWLNGGAGTGKSTIARTIARRLKESNSMLLGASFFFKRGEENRGNAKRLFSTLVQQLIIHIPELSPGVKKIIDSDPYISDKALGEQFSKLLLQPLLEVETDQPKVAVIVIDALDECQSERQDEDIRTILQLLPRARESKSMQLRFFLTSRPELPLRLGFKKIMPHYRDMDLYDIPESEIKHDITLLLEYEFSKIREEHEISSSWPEKEAMQALVTRAIPLFISATTLCRFIGDSNWNPQQRLDIILKDRTEYVSRMSSIYLPILNQFLSGQNKQECSQLVQEFQRIIGAIILLAIPLSIHALSQLLGVTTTDIKKRLGRLHSVLDVPEKINSPVRILHLSFRDFLLDSSTKDTGESEKFWIDEKIMHQNLTDRCIDIMHTRLKRNICNLSGDGVQRHDIDMHIIDLHLPSELQYACQHWVHHLIKGRDPVTQLTRAHSFLNEHFLHWVEAMGILGLISEVVRTINTLQLIMQDNKNPDIFEFLYDAKRFILKNRQIVDTAPLQLYSSGLAFAPRTSKIRNIFEKDKSNWLHQLPEVEEYWGAEISVLEDHSKSVQSVAFSNSQLASGSDDGTVKLWDPITGELYQTLEGHSDAVRSVAFSSNQLASGSNDGTIKLWDPVTGKLYQTLEGHSDYVNSVAFSNNLLASGSQDGTVKLWDPVTGRLHQTLESHASINCVAFSNNQLASGAFGGTINLWNTSTGELYQTFEDHPCEITMSVVFSPNNQLLASGSIDGTIKLWDLTTNELHRVIEAHSNSVQSMVFSSNNLLVSCSGDGMIKFWDPITGELCQVLEHSNEGELQEKHPGCSMVESIAFSADGQILASGSNDTTIKLWDPTITGLDKPPLDHASSVELMTFSPDGQLLASASDKSIKIWDPIIGKSYQTFEDDSSKIRSIVLSSDNPLLISGSLDGTIKFWDLLTFKLRQTIKGHDEAVTSLAFSPDNQLLASGSWDKTVKLWNPITGILSRTLKNHSEVVQSLTFSSNGQLLAVGSRDNTINLWNPVTGKLHQTLKSHSRLVDSLAFSPDGQLLASSSDDGTTKLWNPITGELRRTLNGHSRWMWLENEVVSLLKDQWICYQNEKKLWFPVEYRPCSMAIKDGIIILGFRSGRVLFISCSLNQHMHI